MNPIYSRSSRLVKSKQGFARQRGEGKLLTLSSLLPGKKLQKGGWISSHVSKPPGYELVRSLLKKKRKKRRRRR